MKKLKKMTMVLLCAMMAVSSFAGCTDDEEYDDTSAEIIDEDFAEKYSGLAPLDVEITEADGVRRPAKRALADIKLTPGIMADGSYVPEKCYLLREGLSGDMKKAYDIMRAAAAHGDKFAVLSSINISVDDAVKVYECVYGDSSDLFWINLGLRVVANEDDKNRAAYILFSYDDFLLKNRKEITKQIDESVSKAVADMWCMDKDIDKVKYAHDYICHFTEYNLDAPYSQSCYSVFINRETVCAGYSSAMQYLMHKVGVPCAKVSSNIHQWNVLKLDGEYYEMDVTWDDGHASENNYCYRFFNQCKAVMDTWKGNSHHGREAFNVLPDSEGTKYSFDNYYGGKKEYYGTDFDSYHGTIDMKPMQTDDNDNAWWNKPDWWNFFDLHYTKEQWQAERDGVWSIDYKKFGGRMYYVEKSDEYYIVPNGTNVLCKYNKQSGVWDTIDEDITDNKPVETQPTETQPVQTEPVETTPAETQPTETQPTETQPTETQPEETQPVETESENGWWNALDDSWKKSDWTSVKSGVWKIYDSAYSTTYYFDESSWTFYYQYDGSGDFYKWDNDTGDWVLAKSGSNAPETEATEKVTTTQPVETTVPAEATTTYDEWDDWNDDDYNYDDDYNDGYDDDSDNGWWW